MRNFFWLVLASCLLHFTAQGQTGKSFDHDSPKGQVAVLTNQVGYESSGPKRAVVQADSAGTLTTFTLEDAATRKEVYSGQLIYAGTVDHWRHWQYWTADFSAFKKPGKYLLYVGAYSSAPFRIGDNILESATLSDLVYYFKGQRCSGLLDEADRHLPDPLDSDRHVDLHGGWYDATGDYGKHLSHLSFSNYFNPQQIPFTVWSLLSTYALIDKRPGTSFRQYKRRMLDEGLYGADYLVRSHVKGGSFYRSVSAPGPGKLPKDRRIAPDEPAFRIKASKDQTLRGPAVSRSINPYMCSYRSGGGMAIAALALAARSPEGGEYPHSMYLKAAEDAFAFLEKHNTSIVMDGKENILDDYCALIAATELYNVTRDERYHAAAIRRAERLCARLASWDKYTDYWRADDQDRPFFHAADAGLPVVSLLNFYTFASGAMKQKILQVVRRSLEHEMAITNEVANPFGYSRQLVQDTLGHRRAAFFFPHNCETAPWWQGEDARLASMAAAARLAIPFFSDEKDKPFRDSLEGFALDQLNWILGENPFASCLMQGTGYNNPPYGFFGSFEYTNAPGGIVNGITSGLNDETSIDFNLPYALTGKDYDWRWAEQWLPHASWFMLAVALRSAPDSLRSSGEASAFPAGR